MEGPEALAMPATPPPPPMVAATLDYYRNNACSPKPAPCLPVSIRYAQQHPARSVLPSSGLAIAVTVSSPRRHSVIDVKLYRQTSERNSGERNPGSDGRCRDSADWPQHKAMNHILEEDPQNDKHAGEQDAANTRNPRSREISVPMLHVQQPLIGFDGPAAVEIHNPLDPRYLGSIPCSFTTQKLQEWGDVYLGNKSTADAFVRAVPIPQSRRTSAQLQREHPESPTSPPSPPSPETGLFRVKIMPKDHDRKAFFMQKRFPRRRRVVKDGVNKTTSSRANRAGLEEGLADMIQHCKGSPSTSTSRSSSSPPAVRQEPLPIHIEYALYRAPLLAAILLSGHVGKGDTVEVPMPYPEVWAEVVVWVYTGRGTMTEILAENVEYLGGQVV